MTALHPTTHPRVPRPQRRRAIALATAGGLLATMIGFGVASRADQPTVDTTSGASGGSSAQTQAAPPDRPRESQWGTTTAQAAADTSPATDEQSVGVVLVETVLGSGDGETRLGAGAGTGIVLTAEGQVLTNYHVVESSADIRVTVATPGRRTTPKSSDPAKPRTSPCSSSATPEICRPPESTTTPWRSGTTSPPSATRAAPANSPPPRDP